MALKYPTFDQREWDHVKCPLAVATLYSKVRTAEVRRARHQAEYDRLKSEADRYEQAIKIRTKYGELMEEVAQYRRLPEGERRHKLSEMYRALSKSVAYPGVVDERSMALTLLSLYSTPAVSAFSDDILAIAVDDVDSEAVANALHKEDQEIKRANRDIDHLWDEAPELFNSIPKQWRGIRSHAFEKPSPVPEESDESRRKIAQRMVTDFCTDWRTRVRFFDKSRPVTVAGVAIDTMPASSRDAWAKAYDALGLDKVERQIFFRPIARPKSEAEKAAEAVEAAESKGKGLLAKVFG